MKVLMFGWEFPPHISGGLGTACAGLTRGLAESGTEIAFVVPRLYGDEPEDMATLIGAEGVEVSQRINWFEESDIWKKVIFYEGGVNLLPYVSPENYENLSVDEHRYSNGTLRDAMFTDTFSFSGNYGSNLMEEVGRYALTGAEISGQVEHDVIHAHDWLTYPAGVAAAKVSGKPLVIHVHATEFDRSGDNINRDVFEIERSGMIEADHIIAVSEYTRNIIVSKYGQNRDKVTVVHNGVDSSQKLNRSMVRKNVKEKVVTFLGRVTFQKGPDYFIEAAGKILQKESNVRFVMAGSGDMLNSMIKKVAAMGIASRFHFTGFLKGRDVEHMYALSDAYVMPSVSEPFGIAPLEAMMADVPVIISRQSGVSEVLNHAFKVDFWDVDALADAIYGLIKYRGLAEMFRRYGRSEVIKLKWGNAAHKVNQVYMSMTG